MTKTNALKKFIKYYFGIEVDGNSPLSVLTSLNELAEVGELPGAIGGGKSETGSKKPHLTDRQIVILQKGIKPASTIIDGEEAFYYTFEEVIDAANAATGPVVINFNKDVEVETKLELKNDITFNLNGCNLSQKDGGRLMAITNGATVTINGRGSDIYGRIDLGAATNNNGSVIINGGTYHCCENQTCLHINGTCTDSNVEIHDATITSPTDNGIQLNGAGTFVIDNCKITGATGIYIKSGSLNLTNTSVKGTMTPVNYSYNGNGAQATGDAIVVDACEYPGGAPMLLVGLGNFLVATKAEIGYYLYDANHDGQYVRGAIAAVNSSYSAPEGFAWKKRADGLYDLVEV